MTTINDLKGFCYPLTPGGVSSLVGDMPWHYATEYLNIAYRTDPAAMDDARRLIGEATGELAVDRTHLDYFRVYASKRTVVYTQRGKSKLARP